MLLEHIKEDMSYNPDTGEFWWKKQNPSKTRQMDAPVGIVNTCGYITVKYKKKQFLLHRLAFYFMSGTLPEDNVDHINGDRRDNRWCNLREASCEENSQNRKTSKNSTTGLIGVKLAFSKSAFPNRTKRYTACISFRQKRYYLGLFKTAKEAHLAYCKKKAELHSFNPVPRGENNDNS